MICLFFAGRYRSVIGASGSVTVGGKKVEELRKRLGDRDCRTPNAVTVGEKNV
jgi:hypothetical protein